MMSTNICFLCNEKINLHESNVWVRVREIPDDPKNLRTIDLNSHYKCFFIAAEKSNLGEKFLEKHDLEHARKMKQLSKRSLERET
jgi:hypothetical protein